MIVDDDGEPVPAGRARHRLHADGAADFEYKGDPDKTAGRAGCAASSPSATSATWTTDGFLFLCDRKSDMIISGGANIYPAEIEAEIIIHPKVADVAVFGIPDDDWGEQVKAVVAARRGVAAGAELAAEILASLDGRLARMKWPKIDRLHRRAAPRSQRQAAQAPAPRPVLGRARLGDLSGRDRAPAGPG